MNTYVTLYRFTEQGVRTIKDAPKRVEMLHEQFKAAGAEIKQFYGLMGQYDTMIIAEAPNDEVMIKLNLMIDAMGNVTSQTLRAFSETEFKKVVAESTQLAQKVAKAA